MRWLRGGLTTCLLLTMTAPALRAQDRDAAGFDAFRTGAYDVALEAFRERLEREPADARARIGLMETLLATGDYEEALEVGRAAPAPAVVGHRTGDALVRLGRLDEAEQAYTAAAALDSPWRLTAEVSHAELAFARGRIDEAMERFDRFIDIYNGAGGGLSGLDLLAVGRAVRYLGRIDPLLFQDALRAFEQASDADPTWHEPRVRIGQLFLEKYDSPSAQAEFSAVLEVNALHPEALLGMARARIFDNASNARELIERVIGVDPNNAEARTLLALQSLTNEGHEEAREQAERALRTNPRSLPALTALAGYHLLRDETSDFQRVRARALAINPSYAQMDVELADLAVKTRRYRLAVERADAAVALDPAAWEAWGILGMNRLRVGDITEGRADLERAFDGDPFNPWFKNSLDLLDTFERYEPHRTEHFELFLHGTESELLANYLAPIAEEAYAALSARYGVEPELPVRAELFPYHADFSVRTLGEAGLGALGVSFGRVLVMDSPSARELGDYNWASVFWHELAHTFHLAMTENRVPRWFSEGLAVHEQRQARPEWGHQPTIGFVQALRDDRLKAVSELDDGFMRPDYPEQVVFSYYQASLVFQLIEERYGFAAIRSMLEGYRRGESTETLFTSVLDASLGDFDDEFDDYLRTRFASPLAGLAEVGERLSPVAGVEELRQYVRRHPGDLLARLRLGAGLFQDGLVDEAEEHLREAVRIFPELGGASSPYWYLAQIHRERGELEEAAAMLARLTAISESSYEGLMAQAGVLRELGRVAESAEAMDKAILIWPYEIEGHQRLAELHEQLGNTEGVVRERGAVVALDPVDRAEALYLLAVAHQSAGDVRQARRTVMGALEIAPNYDDALELLLELRGSGGGAPR